MTLRVEDWGFTTTDDGGLAIGGVRADALAREFGTPVHVIDEFGLERRARALRDAFIAAWPGAVTPYFAMKANNTPGIVARVLDQGFAPEVGTPFEWMLARHLGVPAREIMINGPNKGSLLETAVLEGAGMIVVDGFEELERLGALAAAHEREAPVLVRINPNVVPKGMNRASATGSRTQSVFGFDLVSGEVSAALRWIARTPSLRFVGLHCHVGTGIRRPDDYRRALEILADCAVEAGQMGLSVEVLDIGGGFGVPTSRELDTLEFLLYQAVGRLPTAPTPVGFPSIEEFALRIGRTLADALRSRGITIMPRLVIEPGRAVVSGAGVLLVGVGGRKERAGVGTWIITDGAAGTVAFPLFYEYHEVFLCRAPHAPPTKRYSIVGPVCFSADWVYRNKRLPPVRTGDVLAVCDAGAYFTVQESSFGFPHPPIVAVRNGRTRVLRRRETFDDMVRRDVDWGQDRAACA
jgi:diaminopimelate decarboxylase